MVTQKLYCYVDETGQDTKGRIFIVSVIITKEDRDKIIKILEKIEKETEKKRTKWQRTDKTIREEYIKAVFSRDIFKNKILYALFQNEKSYKYLTILTIAIAVNTAKTQEKYKASIFIDGLQKSEVAKVGSDLRKIGISTEKVKGVRDESNSIIRLADAISGLVRDCEEGKEYAKKLCKLGSRNKTLQEIGVEK